jgi:hypothetical protein
MLFAHDLPIELVAILFLLLKDFVAPAFEGAKTLFDAAGDATIEPDRRAGEIGEEAAVVADQHHGRPHGIELCLKPFDDGQIEMVGRLVEQQHIGLWRENARERGATAFTARQGLRVFGTREAEGIEEVLGPIFIITRPQALLDIGEGRLIGREIRILWEIADGRARFGKATAGIVLDEAGGYLEKGGLARAIAPDKRNSLAGRDNKLGCLEKLRAAKSQLDILQGEKWGRSHIQFQGFRRDRAHGPQQINVGKGKRPTRTLRILTGPGDASSKLRRQLAQSPTGPMGAPRHGSMNHGLT